MRARSGPASLLALAAFLAATPSIAAPTIGGCPVFPPDNIWNARVDTLPVHEHSDAYVASIGAGDSLKPDFGAGLYEGSPMGIPYVVVPYDQPLVPVLFAPFPGETEVNGEESDRGPFPVPAHAPIEGGAASTDDRHVLVVQQGSCKLYELYKAVSNGDGTWNAVGSAVFDLGGHALRREGWTSADAAGLPIFPGLVRYDEVAAGEIAHALRFTARKTRKAYVWPARHYASESEDEALPPMGQRFRLKAEIDISGYSPANQVILRALQTYGMILADNGSPWFLSGAPDKGWNNEQLQDELRQLKGSDFEAVDSSSLMREADSGQIAGQ